MRTALFLFAGLRMTVTVLLAIVPFISATPSPLHPPEKRLNLCDPINRQCAVLPKGWSYLGCYMDPSSQPVLTSFGFTDPDNMSVELCVNTCIYRGHIYAGVENGEDCYCGNVMTVNSAGASPNDCQTRCVGSSIENCGGSSRLDLYYSGAPVPPQPSIVPVVSGWGSGGCYTDSDNSNQRILSVPGIVDQYDNSVENCIAACVAEGLDLAGVEFARECWCGTGSIDTGYALPADHCMLACPGNSAEICGGANSFVLYAEPQDES